MITIYTISYNEELVLPFFIKWYRERFPNCKIVVYDNYSTDNTEKIALENNCEVIKYDTNNKLSDIKYLEIKNNCWKNATTDWVLVCDTDEFVDLYEHNLNDEQTLFKSKGYNMYNVKNLSNILDIKYGIESSLYDKVTCFNKKEIKEINYYPGCHVCKPIGNVKFSNLHPKLLHMKYLNEDYIVERYRIFRNRMSDENIKYKWGIQYLAEEEIIRQDFKNNLKNIKNIYE